jgi:hypothetical protein
MDEFIKRTGYVITITIEFEKLIDDFLSKHFCYEQNRQDDFKNLILYNERISLDFKRELFTVIIKKEYKDLLTKNSTVLSDLGRLPEHRNRFAHLRKIEEIELQEIKNNKIQVWSGINGDKTLSEINDDTIIFKRYKNGSVKYLGYGQNEIDEMKAQLTNIAYFLFDVYKVMDERHLNIVDEKNKIKVEVLTKLKEEILKHRTEAEG